MPRKATFSKLDAWLECDQALTAAHLYKQERRVSANTLPEADDHLRSSEITIEIAMSVAGMRVWPRRVPKLVAAIAAAWGDLGLSPLTKPRALLHCQLARGAQGRATFTAATHGPPVACYLNDLKAAAQREAP